MDTSERIKHIISTLKLNNFSFSKSLGTSNTTIDRYTTGRKDASGKVTISKPNFQMIKRMVEVFKVNPYYILGLSNTVLAKDQYDDDTVVRYIIENDERLSDNIIFKEYLKGKQVEFDIEKLEDDIALKKEAIKEKLLNRLNELDDK